ncbi:MAG: hypothetical protein KatS3mg011_1059 [Acidimicrobiia bacterium]|nr:MAG: hypothetical protein KatS3mg011_1059 [Acidimicrobiia bacterium]
MIVANDVSVDARVRKMAIDLAAAGLRVTVLGISRSGSREEYMLGDARLILLPVDSQVRVGLHHYTHTGRRRFIARSPLGPRTQLEVFLNFQREVGARIGWLRRDYFEGRARRARLLNLRDSSRRDRLNARRTELLHHNPRDLAWLPLKARNTLVFIDSALLRIIRASSIAWYRVREKGLEGAFRARERILNARLQRAYRRIQRARRWRDLRAQFTQVLRGLIRKVLPPPNWRKVLLELHDYDAAFGPELDRLGPDVVHVHDVHLLGVAARSIGRAYITGSTPLLVYDAHEYVQGLARYSSTVRGAWYSLEREYIHRADSIITVSPQLADLLQRDHGLAKRPTVILNAPMVEDSQDTPSLRSMLDLADDIPLAVYSGGIDQARGVDTLVEALGYIPDLHLAIVCKEITNYVLELKMIATKGGYADRLHIAPFVQPHHVVPYLSAADVAIHPLSSGPINHEVALPNKLFEYIQARLPVVVSDCRAMAELVQRYGFGEVFRSGDSQSLARALEKVLTNIASYRAVYRDRPDILRELSWHVQREKLIAFYQDLLGDKWSLHWRSHRSIDSLSGIQAPISEQTPAN